MNNILFAKTKTNAVIPSKRIEDGAFDIYACFDEDNLIIEPFTSKLVPTGIASAFSPDFTCVFRERGSTGVKNIKINAGVIDSGFRNEWFVCLYNANTKPLIITKEKDTSNLESDYVVYPYSKAIAQCLVVPVPKIGIEEITYDDLILIPSERGMGQLGSSGK